MKLEGFDPDTDEVYRSLKADVLAGKMDFDQAVEAAVLSAGRGFSPGLCFEGAGLQPRR